MPKYCETCGFLDLTQNACSVFRTRIDPQTFYCERHTYADKLYTCQKCGIKLIRPVLDITNPDIPLTLCPECAQRMSGCYGCDNGNKCEFETNPSPAPKTVQRQIQQGPMIQIIQVKNPDRIAQTCAVSCPCWDRENNQCKKEHDYCDSYKCNEIYQSGQSL